MNKNSETSIKESPGTLGIWKKNLLGYVSLLFTGIGVGWLVGLSVSPVISIVITSIIGSIAAIIAAVSGLDNRHKDSDKSNQLISLGFQTLDTLPITALVIGLVIGSYFGVQARTHDWLEPDISLEIEKWSRIGIPSEKVRDEMFKSHFSNTNGVSNILRADEGVLFSIGSNDCDSLRGKTGKQLTRELETSVGNLQLRQLPNIIEDTDILEELVEKVLCPE